MLGFIYLVWGQMTSAEQCKSRRRKSGDDCSMESKGPRFDAWVLHVSATHFRLFSVALLVAE